MKKITALFILCLTLFVFNTADAFSRGIYITQSTAENKAKLTYLINQSKKFGIDTFIVDVNVPSKRYAMNVKAITQNGIRYIARVVIFPHGGTHAQVMDKTIWAKRLALAKYAIGLGAAGIQLDYIRYRAENPPRPEKAKDILRVVSYFKNALKSYNVSLQMDIFGVAAHKPAHTIGQDVGVLASVVNAFCPMVYPSHYEPFLYHAVRPYETILNSITALKKQLVNHSNVRIYAYIELYNYRYKLSGNARLKYIAAQMKAAKDAGSNGWYVWSPNNHYKPLFQVLTRR
ncbi:MAG: hypothetical protein COY58_09715 [Gammaproteobacteria bacterium CG_4_10_14_0_8_um_filter_38_16]|nr:MAG: hypothetical protein COY58_09715 [Gammaproteobacteria bacterium CG_4_10_14_0_8_um_filter_38_16]PJA03040.1 MAG: hypothetical protein COX72_06950 [Gammaproteobacteria bacterium CG_4_10_14_0_2_um_filter_38_22]PJB10230.1 MAG: hypothetical protein CO120_05965 [Gammaproteobacteria bacterium CG_4_9_14_3_um_filter_38_9]